MDHYHRAVFLRQLRPAHQLAAALRALLPALAQDFPAGRVQRELVERHAVLLFFAELTYKTLDALPIGCCVHSPVLRHGTE